MCFIFIYILTMRSNAVSVFMHMYFDKTQYFLCFFILQQVFPITYHINKIKSSMT